MKMRAWIFAACLVAGALGGFSAYCSDVDSIEDNSIAADFHHHAQYRGTEIEQLHATRTAQTRLQILPTLRQPQIHTRIECEAAGVSCRQ